MKKTAFIFPGQGSQYSGMGKALYEKFPVARQAFEEANEALGFDLAKLCFEGSMEELTKTENTQPAILTVSVAAFRAYSREFGFVPQFAAGHSLGEFSALVSAEALSFSDAVKIVRKRGRFMQEAASEGLGSMAAITGMDKETIEEECSKISAEQGIVVVSNYNSPQQTVISGHKAAVEKVSEILKGKGAAVTPLKVSAPFHSPLMQPAADKLKEELEKYTYNDLKHPVLSNVNALPYEGKSSIIENLAKQIVSPVQWVASMKYLQGKGIEAAIELGPQTVLRNLMKKNAPDIKTFSFDKEEDIEAWKKLAAEDNKPQIKENDFDHTVVTKCIAIAVCTRNRNWDNEQYQKGVIEPYRKIQKLQEQIEKENRKPTLEEMKEALEMLRSVFTTKQVPVEEQVERYNEVFDVTGTRQLFSDFAMPA